MRVLWTNCETPFLRKKRGLVFIGVIMMKFQQDLNLVCRMEKKGGCLCEVQGWRPYGSFC
jgi:hypothetical protein